MTVKTENLDVNYIIDLNQQKKLSNVKKKILKFMLNCHLFVLLRKTSKFLVT